MSKKRQLAFRFCSTTASSLQPPAAPLQLPRPPFLSVTPHTHHESAAQVVRAPVAVAVPGGGLALHLSHAIAQHLLRRGSGVAQLQAARANQVLLWAGSW